jgi:hypothetical protein
MDLLHEASGCIAQALHHSPQLCQQMGLQGMACLAASSRTVHDACRSALLRDPVSLLQPLLALRGGPQLLQQYGQAVAWLVQQLAGAPKAAADVAAWLVYVPNVPLVWAEKLVAAGVRISWQQLLAAANSMVAGVEVWVQAQQQYNLKTDIPSVALALCCRKPRNWVRKL